MDGTFNDRIAKLAGFEPVPNDFAQLFILLMNYIPLTLANSYSKKRINFPKLSGIKIYEVDISELIDRKNDFIMMKKRLENKL